MLRNNLQPFKYNTINLIYRKHFFTLLAIFCFQQSIGQLGSLPTFSTDLNAYNSQKSKIGAQVFDLITDPQGRLIISTENGISFERGTKWEMIDGTEDIAFPKFYRNEGGKIYLGGGNGLGYLALDSLGAFQYHSLKTFLPDSLQNNFRISSIQTDGEDILFQARYHCFNWTGQEMRIERAPRRWYRSFRVGKEIYFYDQKKGLFRRRDGQYELVSGEIKGLKIKNIYPCNPLGLEFIIVSGYQGLFQYRNNVLSPVNGEVDPILKETTTYFSEQLPNGSLLLATNGQGLILTDLNGKLLAHWKETNGFPDDLINVLRSDPGGGFWVGYNRGFSKIDLSATLTFFNEDRGLNDNVTSIVRFDDELFAGTLSGEYHLSNQGGNPQFEALPSVKGFVHDAIVYQDYLVIAYKDGLYLKGPAVEMQIPDDVHLCLYPERKSKQNIWAGGREWIYHYILDGTSSRLLEKYHVGPIVIHDLVQTRWNEFLLTSQSGETYHYQVGGELKILTTEEGWNPDMGISFFSRVLGKELLCTQKGLYTWKKSSDPRLVPDNSLGDLLSRMPIDQLTHISERKALLYSEGALGLVRRDYNGVWNWDTIPFLPLQSTTVRSLYIDGESVFWIGTDEGLYRYDTSTPQSYDQPFDVLISGFVANSDSALPIDGQLVELSAELNDLQFDYYATFSQFPEALEYAVKLEGYDTDWSQWAQRTTKEYTNLPGGNYSFKVKARNIYQTESESEGLGFYLATPWYLQTRAYFLYGVSILLLIWLLVRVRIRRLEQAKARLEGIVLDRTAEIEAQKEKLVEEKLETEKQRDRAESSEASKQQFFANMTHELRTPMTLIIGPVEQMIRDKGKVTKKRLGQVQRNGKKLLRLINQLLDIAKIESERMVLQPQDLDLVRFCKEVTDNFKGYAEEKGVLLSFSSSQQELITAIDPEKIEKVLYNLLSNAIKFTQQKGTVNIAVKLSENESVAYVLIKDSGMGIPEEDLPHVFDRFYQSTKVKSQSQGTGIGLALTKELIELHEGNIQVKSIEGLGTEFQFQLPVLTSGTTALNSAQMNQIEASPNSDEVDLYQIDEAERGPAINRLDESELIGESSRPLLLLVEDNSDVRSYVRSCIPEQYRIMEAGDGQQGLDLALEFIPDLVVADIMMPVMNGYELTTRLKDERKTSHIPIIQLTSLSEQENKIEGLKTGADAYLTKPFDPNELLIRVNKLVALRQSLKEKYRSEVLMQPKMVEATSMEEKFLLTLKGKIHAHLGDDQFSVDGLAEEMGMSRVQLHRKFKALTGETPGKFIRKYRLDTAKDLLEKKTATVAEIAFDCGFSSPAYFSKCFNDEFGETPSSIRNK